MQRIFARVEGRVQGVGFRYNTAHRAHELGLTGWVRNLPDGSVELEAQGSEGRIRSFIDFLGIGPPGARVTRVEVSPRGAQSGEPRFEIL